MKRKLTLKDIARELDVSISTVSKALKNSPEISRDTKDKIQAFARLYNYRPNNIALSLKNKRTKNIGVIIPDIVHHYFTTVFRGIEKYANKHGYNVLICVSDESFDKEVMNMELLANGSVDGIIMSLSAGTEEKNDFNHLSEITEQGIPLVLFDRITDQVSCDKVVNNDFDISYEVVSKLLDSGRKKVALITTESYFNVSQKRADGYKKALLDNGIPFDESLVLVLPPKNLSKKRIEEFIGQHKVDACFCVNELFPVVGMRVAQNMGLQIPEDIAFTGFTDGILSRYSSPGLTTVDQHGEEMGKIAAQMLIERVEAAIEEDWDKKTTYHFKVVPATVIERESS